LTPCTNGEETHRDGNHEKFIVLKIFSKPEHIKAGKTALFDFLEDLTNYEQLMPEQITDWKAETDRFRFTVPGMADIGMRLSEVNRYERVVLLQDGKAPFSFSLSFLITPGDEQQQARIEFDADMPAMLSMMAKRPLQNLIDHMISSLHEHFQD
jgi:hypothetical protein